MAYRNPQAPSPGRMNMLPGQQQIPTGQQFMQQGMVGGMPRQQYPMIQQGMMPGQMYHQAMYQRPINPQDFQGMRGGGQQQIYNMPMQGYMIQGGQFPGAMPQQQPVEITEEMKKKMEKDKKERQFQEQQRRLKMYKPGVQSSVNPLDDLIGRQLGGSSSTNRPAPEGDMPGMMQIGGYMQSQHLPQGNMMPGGMVIPHAGMFQSQPGMMMQAQGMGLQQGLMNSQLQGFQGASNPRVSTQLPGMANHGLGPQQQGMMMSQASMVSAQPQNVLPPASNNPQQSASQGDDVFGDFLQGPTMGVQPSSHSQMQTTFSTQLHTVTSQQLPLQTSQAQDEFGSFLQGPTQTPSNPSIKPTNEFGNFTQGPTAALPQESSTEPVPALDTSFGEFEKGPIQGTQETEAERNPVEQEGRTSSPTVAIQPEAANTKADKKQTGMSLEDMMVQSTNLSAPKTTRKMFNQKKSLDDFKTASTQKTQAAFNDSDKARVWSQSKNLAGLFATPVEENAATQLEGTVQRTVDQTISQQEVPQSGNKCYPEWCLNESNLPLVYHQVLEATWNGSEIQTDKLYPILMCSNLEKQVLGHIWSLVNNTKPGQLVKQEMYLALGLIGLAQNGVSPLSLEMVKNFREAPIPQLTPKQSAVGNGSEPPASATNISNSAKAQHDDFAAFQEAPKAGAENQGFAAAVHPNLPSTTSFDNHNLTPSTFPPSSVTVVPPPMITSCSNDVLSGDLEMVSYVDQEAKSYNFHDPPSRNSSCHSSPVIWGHDTTRDKLWKSVGGESSSLSSDEDFTEFQSGSGSISLSLEDRKDDFDDFKGFSSAQDTSPAVVSSAHSDKKPHLAKTSGKKVKSVTKPNLNINFDAYKKPQDNKGVRKLPSSASAPKLTKLAESSTLSRLHQKDDDDDGFADFQTFSSSKSNVDTSSLHSFQSSKKSDSVNDFGNFQHSTRGVLPDFDKVKHSVSDTDLMALSGEVDKYSALRGISFSIEPEVLDKNNAEGSLASDFDTMSLGSSTGLPPPSGSSGPPLDSFGDFAQAPVIKESNDHKDDNGFTDFQHFPTSSSSASATGEADGFADFQSAPSSTFGNSGRFPGFQSGPLNKPGNLDGFADFKSASTSDPQVDSFANFKSASTKSDTDDQFASFKSASVDNQSKKNVDRYQVFTSLQDQDKDMTSIFKKSEKIPENTETNTFAEQSSGNFDSFKSVEPVRSEKFEYGVKTKQDTQQDDYDDDFGDFKFNEPPPLDDDNFGPSNQDDHFGGFESSVAEYYGMEFDSLDDLSRSNSKTKNENSFGTYQVADNGSKKCLGKLESIASLDLKTFDLDLNLGAKVNEEEGEVADDSFGDFSSAPPLPDNLQASELTSAPGPKPPVANQMIPSTPAFGGDRYAMLAGDIQDDARHVLLWKRCLTSCLKVIQQANDTLNNISSSSVCNEVMKSVDGSEYLKGVIEIYRVACRVSTSIKAAGVGTDELNQMQKDIELVWNNLSAFLASASILPDDKSFIFKMAVLHPEPSNISMACGVCLLNVDARSKAIGHSEDNHKLTYGGRQYHATCANLWVNLVDSILPALPFNQLL